MAEESSGYANVLQSKKIVVHCISKRTGRQHGKSPIEPVTADKLMMKLDDNNVHGFNPSKLDKQQLHSFLQGTYDPVYAKWTAEKCAVCRWDVDWEDNNIIICSRCQIGVHQDCYGAKHVSDSAEWVCRACETAEVERECCLCPVKGGALKSADVDNLWVHITCAWNLHMDFLGFLQFLLKRHAESASRYMVPVVGVASVTLIFILCAHQGQDIAWNCIVSCRPSPNA